MKNWSEEYDSVLRELRCREVRNNLVAKRIEENLIIKRDVKQGICALLIATCSVPIIVWIVNTLYR